MDMNASALFFAAVDGTLRETRQWAALCGKTRQWAALCGKPRQWAADSGKALLGSRALVLHSAARHRGEGAPLSAEGLLLHPASGGLSGKATVFSLAKARIRVAAESKLEILLLFALIFSLFLTNMRLCCNILSYKNEMR